MRYIPPLFRPPSEASSYILQATLGCSWNNCTLSQSSIFSLTCGVPKCNASLRLSSRVRGREEECGVGRTGEDQ